MNHPEHICRFNDGPQNCECYDAGYKEAIVEEGKRVENTPHPMLPDINKVKDEALLKNNTVNYELGFLHGAEAMRTAIIASQDKPLKDKDI